MILTDKREIREAIEKLEKNTSGEVVPVIVNRCDTYQEVHWFTAVIMTVTGLSIIIISSYLWVIPAVATPINISVFLFGLLALGYALPFVFPSLKRTLTADERLSERVLERAMEEFLAHEVFLTEKRIGILFFISRFEHRAIVLADKGINALVDDREWEKVVRLITDGMRSKNMVAGVVSGIQMCEKILLDNGFINDPEAGNQLPDQVQIEE